MILSLPTDQWPLEGRPRLDDGGRSVQPFHGLTPSSVVQYDPSVESLSNAIPSLVQRPVVSQRYTTGHDTTADLSTASYSIEPELQLF